MTRKDGAWKDEFVVKTFLEGVRGGIPFAKEQMETMLRLLKALETPVARFMDLGCGDGALAAVLAENFPGAHGTLVDFSGPMLKAARKRFNATDRMDIIKADFGEPAWVEKAAKNAPFDAVVSGFAIHHQKDASKKRLYGEIYSLLRPGGLFLNIEHVASRSGWGKSLSDALFIDSIFEYNRARGKKGTREEVVREFFDRPDKDANLLTPAEIQCEWLTEAGFADVDCFFKAFELAVFGGRRPGEDKDTVHEVI